MEIYIGLNKIHYLQSNKSSSNVTPILFIHGAGATHYVWLNQLKFDIPGYYQIALDLPGHGKSKGEGLKSVDAYTEFIKDFIDALSLSKVVLVGHSMGAAIALNFAINFTNLLQKLVLVGAGAKLRVSKKIFEMVERGEVFYQYAYSPSTPKELIKQAEAEYYTTDSTVRYNDLLACDQFEAMSKIKDIKVKTLIICGQNDLMTPPKYAEYLHKSIKGSNLFIIEDAGHMVLWEKPDEVNMCLKSFLQKVW